MTWRKLYKTEKKICFVAKKRKKIFLLVILNKFVCIPRKCLKKSEQDSSDFKYILSAFFALREGISFKWEKRNK
jgi:hypothetical protein